ncbi:hypothetical protein ILUMI_08202 [Ignelater luminosus]|uniref:Myosin light chain kinase, smooth muscle n=1 Tax=Ignelater luminosus TaxID=2038154 RepID=A0A8K0GH98_IGNLU|nr:hypothetical protein ILUMI_08202 [Ignelater luminosus]
MDTKKFGKIQTIPKIVRNLKDIRCCDGDAVTLECEVDACPPPDIRWEKRGKLIRLGEDFKSDFDGKIARLSIKQVYPEDEGEYTCVAYNELGKSFTSACLLVDVPEEKDNILTETLSKPADLLSAGSTPRSTPRTTPVRSVSPRRIQREIPSDIKPRRIRAIAPKFYAIPHNRVAEEGETIRFQCSVAGHPDPWATWTKDGSEVVPTSRITIKEQDDLRILEIGEVTPQDSGLYRVAVENPVGRIEASARLDVITHRGFSMRGLRARSASPRRGPTFSRRLVGTSANYGSRARFSTDIHSSIPTPYVRWYKDGVMVEDSEKYKLSLDGNTAVLDVENVNFEDAGTYSCVLEGFDVTCANLEVVGGEDREPPAFVQELPRIQEVMEGRSLRLEAKVRGTKPYDVIWMKDACVLPDCEDFQQLNLEDGRIILNLPDVYSQDSGDYRCEVYNPFGEAMSRCRLVVHESTTVSPTLEFLKTPAPVITTPGSNASFCARIRTTGDKTPQITWEVAGVPVKPSDKFLVEEDGDVNILHIVGVTHLDGGQVSCTACLPSQEKSRHSFENGRGENSSSSSGSLVHDNNSSERENNTALDQVCISCSTELTVIPDIINFYDGASNDNTRKVNGSSKKMKKPEEPAMLLRGPQDTTALVGDRVLLKATYMGHPEPSVKWSRAGKELKNDERTSMTSNDGTSCLLLQNITTDDSGKYDVCVENIYGADCHYASVSVEGPPDRPGGKPTVIAGVDTAIVTWSSSPYDGGRIVTGFALEYSLLGSDVWTVAAENCHSLSYTVRGLQPGAQYIFRVRAINVHGSSQPSMESECVQMKEPDELFTFEPRTVLVEPGPEFKNRYEVLEELGKGRYGVVHKVVDKNTTQKLAAKFVRCRTAKEREKVQDEINTMNMLRHQKLLQLAAAFENPRETIMVMEYISGGELFERVVADDFTLTEKDCILFMRQICEGVAYMHSQNVVHLDLKPENIMCHTRTSHEIKIIDFGLAQKINPDRPVRVLFGTPEFIPPEIINYEPIGTQSDMWSVGVICYVLLSGLSPFMGDNDAETFANITRAYYDFDDEAFDAVSQNARSFISALLVKRKESRLSAEECLKHNWLDPDSHPKTVILCTDKLKKFIIRRKWQKTGNAIRALGRMATLSASRRNSAASSSTSNSPRPSLSGALMSRMSSLNEEETLSTNNNVSGTNGVFKNVVCNNANASTKHSNQNGDMLKCIPITEETNNEIIIDEDGDNKENFKLNHNRMCSERSDSGFSDCSAAALCSCTSTPLLSKKFCINEESAENIEYDELDYKLNKMQLKKVYKNEEIYNKTNISKNVNGGSTKTDLIKNKTNHDNVNEFDKRRTVETEIKTNIKSSENQSVQSNSNWKLKNNESNCSANKADSKLRNKIDRFDNANFGDNRKGKSPTTSNGIKPITPTNSVASVIKKFDQLDKSTQSSSEPLKKSTMFNSNTLPFTSRRSKTNLNQSLNVPKSPTSPTRNKSKLVISSSPFIKNSKNSIQVSSQSSNTTPRHQLPSPSLLRKTQAVIAKEQQNNQLVLSKRTSPTAKKKVTNSVKNSQSPPFARKLKSNEKPKSDSFQKASAFWNKQKA